MFHPDTQFLIDRWAELARAPHVRGGIPARAGVAPEDFGARLPRTFLIRGSGPGSVLRLAGSWLEALHDRKLAGSPFLDLWCETSPALVVPALAQAVREARPVVVVAHLGPEAIPVEVVFAPLRDGEERPDLYIGLVAPAASLVLAPGESRRLAARVTIGVGQHGRPELRLVARDAEPTAASAR